MRYGDKERLIIGTWNGEVAGERIQLESIENK